MSLADPESQKRYQAIVEVLSRIPEEAYERLCDYADKFRWFIPHPTVRGRLLPFHATDFPRKEKGGRFTPLSFARVLYLSPQLEKAAWNIVVLIVAHELAHVFLNHEVQGISEEKYQEQEEQIFNLLCEWSFETEAKKHRRIAKWRYSFEKTRYNKLMRKHGIERKRG
jgi:predicted SprT family Zn-dependent metalloprotease